MNEKYEILSSDSKNLEYDEDLRVLLFSSPNWITRNGSIVILVVLFLIGLLSFVVKFPETINASITLHSYPSPVEILAKTTGKVVLLVRQNQEISEGQRLGYIENMALMEDIDYISRVIEVAKKQIENGEPNPFNGIRHNLHLGEIQQYYLSFIQSIKNYEYFLMLENYSVQIVETGNQIEYTHRLIASQMEEQEMLKREYDIALNDFKRDSILYKEGVISTAEFDASKLAMIPHERNHDRLNQEIINHKIRIATLRSQLNTIQAEKKQNNNELSNEILSNFFVLSHETDRWKEKYLLTSSMSGKVFIFDNWNSNRNVSVGNEILSIIPAKQQISGTINVPNTGAGKIKTGQKVLIAINDYPPAEFGQLQGEIDFISSIQKNGQYVINVDLPNEMQTNYKIPLAFKEGLSGSASIITEDVRLFEHLFFQLKKALDIHFKG